MNWKKEKESGPTNRTWEEAYEVLVGGVKKSISGYFSNIPKGYINEN